MRFVASTILSVAILAFVTQSVSALPVGSTKKVDEVNQESNVLLKRTPPPTGFDEFALFAGCLEGLLPDYICHDIFGGPVPQ